MIKCSALQGGVVYFSTDKILAPGGPWLLMAMGQGLPIPLFIIQYYDIFFMARQSSSVTSNNDLYKLYETNEDFSKAW